MNPKGQGHFAGTGRVVLSHDLETKISCCITEWDNYYINMVSKTIYNIELRGRLRKDLKPRHLWTPKD